jgi:hypothetical protein
MAIKIEDLKKAVLDVRHVAGRGRDVPVGTTVYRSVPIPVKTAKLLIDAGAKKSLRKSERGGPYDILVVRLNTDAVVYAVVANGKAGGNG